MQLERLAEEFLNHIRTERRFSSETVLAYRHDYRTFARFLSLHQVEPTADSVTAALLRQYLVWLESSGLQTTTIRRRFHGLRSLWRYARDWHGTGDDPFRRVQLPAAPAKERTFLSHDEIRRLLEAAEDTRYVARGIRDRAILTLLVSTGLRRQELVDLRLHDVDLQDGVLRVQRGKGNRARIVPILPEANAALRDWLELRSPCDHSFLFTNHARSPLGPKGVHRLFHRALERAGITRPGITLHSLRHTFATLALRSGCDLRSLQTLLGHASLETTALYTHTDVSSLRRAVVGLRLSGVETEGQHVNGTSPAPSS